MINFLDRPNQPIFQTGTNAAKFTDYGTWVFKTVAWEIARYTNTVIELEGHTTKSFKPIRGDYTGWDVSSDRANLARRRLLDNGVKEPQIAKVSGLSDRKTLKDRKDEDPTNNRVTIMIRGAKEQE